MIDSETIPAVKSPLVNDKEMEQLVELLKSGMRPRRIIDTMPKLEGKNSFIARIRKKHGVPRHPPGRILGSVTNGVQLKVKLARNLRAKNWTLAKIGEKLGVTRECVRQYLEKAC